jgi:hypothetical protein
LAEAADPDAGGGWVDSAVTYLADRSIPPVWHASGTADAQDWHEGAYRTYPVRIHDMRPQAEGLSLDRNGFRLARHRSAVRDFDDEDELHAIYVPEMEALVMAAAGASRAVVLGPTVRDPAARMPVQRPFHRVHSDFTDENGPEWARRLLTQGALEGPARGPRATPGEAEALLRGATPSTTSGARSTGRWSASPSGWWTPRRWGPTTS